MTTTAVDSAMSAQLDRLAAVTSVLRVREQDIRRTRANGGTTDDMTMRVAHAAVRLKQIADDLAKGL